MNRLHFLHKCVRFFSYLLPLFCLLSCTKAEVFFNTIQVSGVAHLNRVKKGTVTIHLLNSDGSKGRILGSAVTNESGIWETRVKPVTDPIILTLSGGTYTDEASGEERTLELEDRYTTVLTELNTSSTVHITPFTHMAALAAIKRMQLGYLSKEVIDERMESLAELMGLKGRDLRTLTPVDLSNEEKVRTASQDEKSYALLIASLSEIVQSQSGTNFSLKELSDTFASDFANDTKYDGQDNGAAIHLGTKTFTQDDWVLGLSKGMFDWIEGDQNTTGITTDSMVTPIAEIPKNSFSGSFVATATVSHQTTTISWTEISGYTFDVAVSKLNEDGTQNSVYSSSDYLQSSLILTDLSKASYYAKVNLKLNGEIVKSASTVFRISQFYTPTLTSISPSSAGSSGGTLLTITGTGFLDGASVLIGQNTCDAITVVSKTQITCTTLSHGPGSVSVQIKNSDDQSVTDSNLFTYTDDGNYWTATSTTGAPVARVGGVITWTGSKILIAFGGQGGYMNTGGQYDPVSDSWTETSTTSAPGIRQCGAAVWSGKELVLWGGSNGITYTAGGKYDPVSNTWTSITATGEPSSRNCPTAVWSGDKAIFWGGYDGGNFRNDGGIYNPAADTWLTTNTTGAPLGRTSHNTVWTGDKMLVWGGNSTSSTGPASILFNTGGLFDPIYNSWSSVSTTGAPSRRVSGISVWTNNQYIVWGGYVGNDISPSTTNTGGIYTPSTNTWNTLSTTNAPSVRGEASSVWTGSQMLVFGGDDYIAGVTGSAYNTGGMYTVETNSWTSLPTTTAPAVRHDTFSVWTGEKMFVWAGKSHDINTYYNTGGLYTPPASSAKNSWTVTTITGAPGPRSYHSVVWTGSKVIVWGGNIGNAAYDDGAAFDSVTNSWSSLASLDAPTARFNHTAVWSGNKLLIWGGQLANSTVINSGGSYDIATNTWSEMTTTSALSARWGHSAIWTGSRMIIWGGTDSLNQQQITGSSYNPVTNVWTSLAIAGAPTGRRNHSAIWSGSEMIIFGGGSYYNTGGRYNPTTDSWTTMSTTLAPPGRLYFSSVWTGDKMIAWGGTDGTNSLNSGGIYNPANNTWTTTSTTSAPSERNGHNMLWTGSRMIVWGGGSPNLNSGGIYNPYSDAWTSMTTTSAPEVRVNAGAVWTGSKMIIFGGLHSTTNLNTGGIYEP